MADARDLTGMWHGDYALLDPNVDPNAFIALLAQTGGGVRGSISERDIWRGRGIVRADVEGMRAGSEVRFVKTYDGSSGMAHSLLYEGAINEAGTEIRGTWSLGVYAGSFTMTREALAGVEVKESEVVTV